MTTDKDKLFGQIFGDGDEMPRKGFDPRAAMAMMLSISGGTPIITGDEVAFHDSGQIVLPRGMSYERASEVLERLQTEAETETSFDRMFRYRPDDGAVATAKVLKQRYGMVFGEKVESMFGSRPPETRSVTIAPGQTVQVPWGRISIPSLEGVQMQLCDAHGDPDYGPIFDIHVLAPLKHQDEINAFFDAVEHELRTNSIYRGKAIVGTESPEFLDLTGFNPGEIVFSGTVELTLEGTVWSVLRHTNALREEGIRLKRAALLHGPYGTGKSSVGMLTAGIAIDNGWTFISARPGRDKVTDLLRLARLYMPAVVFIEDIDGEASTADDNEVAQLLEAFDGITAKGGELVVMMTTNHKDRIHKGMLRPGRLDAVIEINSLDSNGVERLIKAIVPAGKLASTVDFDAVYTAMEGFYPAFIREALERAKTFAVSRLKGARNYVLDTEDLVAAATSLHSQLQMLNEAEEGERQPTLDTVLASAMTNAAQHAVHGTQVVYGTRDGKDILSVPALNGSGQH